MSGLVQRHMKQRAQQLRREMTPAEAHLWEPIRKDRCDGLWFLRQYRVGQYIVDFYCAALRVVIEADGSIHQEPTIVENDRVRQEAIEREASVRFIRWTNGEVLAATPEQLCTRLRQTLFRC
jgi:very-short-patch-repair endonuclease